MSDFSDFRRRIDAELLDHPVIHANPYTAWFQTGAADHDHIVDLVVQFSVFSNHFLVAQVKRMVFAQTLEGEACARSILMSECGVALDPASGSVEGHAFASRNAHLNWLRELGRALGLGPMELGRWKTATHATRKFLRGLERAYGSPDEDVGAGASFAIESWAAFGIGRGARLESRNFWKQLIDGLEEHNRRVRAPQGLPALPLGFFKWHFEVESGHGANVEQELQAAFRRPGFSPEKFLRGGRQALDAIQTFWLGLDAARAAAQQDERDFLAGINVAHWAV